MSAGRLHAQPPDTLPLESVPPAAGDAWRQAVRAAYARQATIAARVTPDRRPRSGTPHSGLGCGSPTAFANLAPGEWVLDLGSGAGFDCLAAALDVGRRGRVVGIDMTPEMVRLAHRHAAHAGVVNVDFLQAGMEALPFADATFDVVISNCVINLCPDKARVLAEACRVLKPNGRLAVADIVAIAPLPEGALANLALHTGCLAGATPLDTLASMLHDAGLAAVEIDLGPHSPTLIDGRPPDLALEDCVAAARVTARKAGRCPETATRWRSPGPQVVPG